MDLYAGHSTAAPVHKPICTACTATGPAVCTIKRINRPQKGGAKAFVVIVMPQKVAEISTFYSTIFDELLTQSAKVLALL